jgi:hypothetical protein
MEILRMLVKTKIFTLVKILIALKSRKRSYFKQIYIKIIFVIIKELFIIFIILYLYEKLIHLYDYNY